MLSPLHPCDFLQSQHTFLLQLPLPGRRKPSSKTNTPLPAACADSISPTANALGSPRYAFSISCASTSMAHRNPIDGERPIPAPGRRNFIETSGGCGPPSKYQTEPSLRNSQPPLRMQKRVRPSVCSLSVRFQTSGEPRFSRPAHPATCHSSSLPPDRLSPSNPPSGDVHSRWRLRINTDVEPDL